MKTRFPRLIAFLVSAVLMLTILIQSPAFAGVRLDEGEFHGINRINIPGGGGPGGGGGGGGIGGGLPSIRNSPADGPISGSQFPGQEALGRLIDHLLGRDTSSPGMDRDIDTNNSAGERHEAGTSKNKA